MKTAEDVLMKWQTKWEMDSSDCPKSHRNMVKVAMEEYAQEVAKNLHKPLVSGHLMEQSIKDKINSATSMQEAEQFAENLTYEISYDHKRADWRLRYQYLGKEDFRKMGWKVLCVGTKDKHFKEWLLNSGFIQHHKSGVFYSKDKTEMFMIDDYGNGTTVGFDNFYDGTPTNLFSLSDYKNLLIEKLMELYEKRKKLEQFINSLIAEHKDFLAQEENEGIKQQIINEALEKAREQKLII